MRRIEEETEVKIFTDGSVGENNRDGGSAVVVLQGDMLMATLKEPAGKLCASYDAELKALEMAARWIIINKPDSAVVYTDSKASINSLTNTTLFNEPQLLKSREAMTKAAETTRVTIQWVPGHTGVAGNEMADRAANEATQLEQPAEASWTAVKSVVKRAMAKVPVTDDRRRRIYSGNIKHPEFISRKEQVMLAQLRSGHCMYTGYYKWKYLGGDAKCGNCGELETVPDHYWDCPATIMTRNNMIGTDDVAEALRERGREVISFLRSTRPNWFETKLEPIR